MKTKEYLLLNEEQAAEGIYLCARVSKKHFCAAEHLEKINEFGIALSLLILSAEEAMKVAIFIRRVVNPTNTESIDKYFKEHISKHKIARESYHELKSFFEIFEELRTDEGQEKLIKYLNEISKHKELIDEEQIIQEITEYAWTNAKNKQSNTPIDRNEIRWWGRAYELKNIGFYVDFKNGKWLSPENITEKEYFESKEIIKNIINPINLILQTEKKEFITNLKARIAST